MSLGLFAAPDSKLVTNQVTEAKLINPRDATFNFNPKSDTGFTDIDIHKAAEVVSEKAVQDLLERFPGASQDIIDAVRAGIKYTAVSKAGEQLKKPGASKEKFESMPEPYQKLLAEKQKTAMAGTLKQGMHEPLAYAERISIAISQQQANRTDNQFRQHISQANEPMLHALGPIALDYYRQELSMNSDRSLIN